MARTPHKRPRPKKKAARAKPRARKTTRQKQETHQSEPQETPAWLRQWIDSQRQAWQAFQDTTAAKAAFPFAMPDLDGWADLSGLGFLREQQADAARFYKAWRAHDAAGQSYRDAMARIALAALTEFEARCLSPRPDDAPFTSLKDAYARFVDISEEIYARFAVSPEHAQLYGDLVNSLSTLKKELSLQADRWASEFNLPTRAEVDSLHRRVHELMREVRELRAQSSKKRR